MDAAVGVDDIPKKGSVPPEEEEGVGVPPICDSPAPPLDEYIAEEESPPLNKRP